MDYPLITKLFLLDVSTLGDASFSAFLPSARMLTEIRLNPSASQLSLLAHVAPQIQDLYLERIRDDAAVISVLVGGGLDWINQNSLNSGCYILIAEGLAVQSIWRH